MNSVALICAMLLGATGHRFGVQSRQPRALSYNLVDCPSCTLVDRQEKRQLRGRRHYIHGSWSLPRSGWRVIGIGFHLSAGPNPQLPYSDVIVAQGQRNVGGSHDNVSLANLHPIQLTTVPRASTRLTPGHRLAPSQMIGFPNHTPHAPHPRSSPRAIISMRLRCLTPSLPSGSGSSVSR